MNALMLFFSPLLLSVALALDTTGATPIDDVIRQLLNLGVGGVVAVVFFWQWQREVTKREASEARERALLLEIVRERSGLKIVSVTESADSVQKAA